MIEARDRVAARSSPYCGGAFLDLTSMKSLLVMIFSSVASYKMRGTGAALTGMDSAGLLEVDLLAKAAEKCTYAQQS